MAKPNSTPDLLRPSIGHDISTIVVRGGSCELDLQGIAMPGETVEFKIKKNPQHGILEGPRRSQRDSVTYTYRHNGKKGWDTDRVEFGLRTGPGNAWGSLTAKISIAEPRASLVVEGGPMDFGSVPIGDQVSKILKIRNDGAGVIRGQIKVYAPWALEGQPDFELREGDGPLQIRVIFTPATSGEIVGRLELQSASKPYLVDLRGEGVYRFHTDERLIIDEKTRAGFLDILNLDSKELSLHLHAPPPLLAEEKITVPAAGSAQLNLAVKDEIYTQKFVDLAVADGRAIRLVRVELPPSPVKLEWDGAPMLNVGRFALRNVPELQIGLKNAGATKASVRLVPCDGALRLPPSQAESFEIPAGEMATVNVIWSLPETLGETQAKIAAMQGNFANELTLQAQVEPPPSEMQPIVNGKKSTLAPTPVPIKQGKKILSESEKKELRLRMPDNLRYKLVFENSAASAVISWNYRGPKPVKFQLERKVVERASVDPSKIFEKRLQVPEQLPNSPVFEKWMPIEDIQAAIECIDGTAWQGRVPGLQSGFHDVRILVKSSDRIDIKEFIINVGELPRPAWMKWVAVGILLLSTYALRCRIANWFGGSTK